TYVATSRPCSPPSRRRPRPRARHAARRAARAPHASRPPPRRAWPPEKPGSARSASTREAAVEVWKDAIDGLQLASDVVFVELELVDHRFDHRVVQPVHRVRLGDAFLRRIALDREL